MLNSYQDDDPRVGSNRNVSIHGGILGPPVSRISSFLPLVGTLILVSIYSILCIVLFLIMRPRCPRVFAPRTRSGLVSSRRPSPSLPDGVFKWIKPFFDIPDTFILNHCSLDGFLFLRYLKVLRVLFLAGCCIAWPILLPVHITGGRGLKGLDLLTVGNVQDNRKFYAHVIVAFSWFSLALLVIVRESLYYINLRIAYASSPLYAHQLSSRTILLTQVPKRYRNESYLRRLFGDSVSRVWIPRTSKALVKLIKERKEVASRLEEAEVKLIVKSNKAYNKGSDPHLSIPPPTAPSMPSTTNSTTENYPVRPDQQAPGIEEPATVIPIRKGARPHHRLWSQFGRKVDTISWARSQIKSLNSRISKLRGQLRRTHVSPLPAAFVEFDTQESANAAHQCLTHHQPLQLVRHLGIRPNDILWQSLRIGWRERIIRTSFVYGLIAAAIILWSFPTAVIGVVSNVELLSENLPFLYWIRQMPPRLLQFLQGFVPALALTLWIAVVPALLRFCAVQAGAISLGTVELFTQNTYFAFLVVQVFLITSFSSTVFAVLPEILRELLKIPDILANSIPRASDFFFSFILIQCLADGASSVFPIVDLCRHQFLGRKSRTPRMQYRVWRRMRRVHWGTIFPRISNMGVITFCYAGIAPIILIFAAGGMFFLQMVYRYNVIYVVDCDLTSTGLFYPQALLHLITGLYLAELCLIGIFILNSAFVPMAFMILLVVLTAFVHLELSKAIKPLVHNLPQCLWHEEKDPSDGQGEVMFGNSDCNARRPVHVATMEQVEESGREDCVEANTDNGEPSTAMPSLSPRFRSSSMKASRAQAPQSRMVCQTRISSLWNLVKQRHSLFGPQWLVPDLRKEIMSLQETVSSDAFQAYKYPTEATREAYLPPELWLPKPTLWIPRDRIGASRRAIAQAKRYTPVTDVGATLDESGHIVTNFGDAPMDEVKLGGTRWEAIESTAPSLLSPSALGL
ncbi:unnamed protein product [Clonostachys rosea]|uniref:CSC1/OSCA1-like 7TM region domain-containing protein n=1 Tax=Bionectria ochroleuca TaxID=29856 RepID=A0ABY6V2B7_BIOOC|nr:unnamed protein product [Clonostachys rosea]